jgi:hypothetical protein
MTCGRASCVKPSCRKQLQITAALERRGTRPPAKRGQGRPVRCSGRCLQPSSSRSDGRWCSRGRSRGRLAPERPYRVARRNHRTVANFARQFALALEGGCQEGDPGKMSAHGECPVGGLGRGHVQRDYLDEPGKPGTWVFPGGPGKWKGVIGSGTYQHVNSSKLANTSSRVIARAFGASADARRSRLGRGHGVSCCNCVGDCIGIRPYPHCPNRCMLRSALSETFETRNMDISQPA